tara:strand:- start:416 stop:1396 length:981 start_codon:yes stop_codon:yes gene_type:complete
MVKIDNKLSQFYKSKSVLITGGSGYIGSHIIDRLSLEDCSIKCFSRNKEIIKRKGIKYIFGDYSDEDIWSEAIKDVDIIFHLASQTSVYVAEDDPSKDYAANVLPLEILAKSARNKNKIPFVVFSGTATQFGTVESNPVSEQVKDNPSNYYDFHKLLAEKYLKLFIKKNFIQGVSLRLCNVYGPGPKSSSHDRGILNMMVKRALDGKDLTIYGSGDYLRDYIFIDDVVNAFILCPFNSEIINGTHLLVGSGEGKTIKEALTQVAHLINSQFGVSSKIEYVNPPSNLNESEFRNFVADNSLIKKKLNWSPEVNFNDGIIKTAKSFFE